MVAKCIKHYTCGNFHVKLDEFISVPEYNKSIKDQKSFSCYYLGTDYNSKPTTQFDITQETFNDFFKLNFLKKVNITKCDSCHRESCAC